MAKGFNWTRAAKERVIRERGHEPLSPDDHTLRKGKPSLSATVKQKPQKRKPVRHTEAETKAITAKWAKALGIKTKNTLRSEAVPQGSATPVTQAPGEGTTPIPSAATKLTRREATIARRQAKHNARIAAMTSEQRAAFERKQAEANDVRLRGIIVERKRTRHATE